MKSPDKCSVERHAVHVEEVGDVLAGAGAYKARFRTTAKSGAIEQRRRPEQVGTLVRKRPNLATTKPNLINARPEHELYQFLPGRHMPKTILSLQTRSPRE